MDKMARKNVCFNAVPTIGVERGWLWTFMNVFEALFPRL